MRCVWCTEAATAREQRSAGRHSSPLEGSQGVDLWKSPAGAPLRRQRACKEGRDARLRGVSSTPDPGQQRRWAALNSAAARRHPSPAVHLPAQCRLGSGPSAMERLQPGPTPGAACPPTRWWTGRGSASSARSRCRPRSRAAGPTAHCPGGRCSKRCRAEQEDCSSSEREGLVQASARQCKAAVAQHALTAPAGRGWRWVLATTRARRPSGCTVRGWAERGACGGLAEEAHG